MLFKLHSKFSKFFISHTFEEGADLSNDCVSVFSLLMFCYIKKSIRDMVSKVYIIRITKETKFFYHYFTDLRMLF